jgi:hypothetical protein
MTWDELRELAAEPLVSIGAHTRNHPILSRVNDAQLEDEMAGSKLDVERELGKPVLCFAYPNGRMIDISPESVQLSRSYFRCAFTSMPGLNSLAQDRHLLKRVGISGSTGVRELELMLSGILDSADPMINYRRVVEIQRSAKAATAGVVT